jgi:hypothetical protein
MMLCRSAHASSSGGGNTLNVTRGQDGTTAQGHNLGAAVRHMITARDLQEPQDHINNGGYHIIVCTSSTRPGSPVDGQHIYETDTDKTLSWDGTSWNPVSGAAAYQPGEPANPSVGSLWVDSDESASQLNTNDFLLKADASASTGYVSKVGGDTVVASGAAVKPLVLKGASSQTANLQEWQDSTGAVVASVSPTGNITGGGLVHIATIAIGTGVSSIPVSNVFSAAFDEYMVFIQGFSSSSLDALQWQLRDAGGNVGGTQYHFTGIEKINNDTFTSRRAASTSSLRVGTTGSTNGGYYQTLRISSPFLSRYTVIHATSAVADPDNYGVIWNEAAGSHLVLSSYTGFNLFPGGATTFTGGTIKVYGLRNS